MVEINSNSGNRNYTILKEMGISADNLRALDLNDGNEDHQIDVSIFNSIENIVNEAKKNSNSNANVAQQTDADHWENAVDIVLAKLKANEIPNRRIAFGITDTVNNKPNDANFEEIQNKMQDFANELVRHYASGKDPEKFKFTGLPIGIDAMTVTYKINDDDSSNDTYSGKGQVFRTPDSATAIIAYIYNGKEYSVTATTTDLGEIMKIRTHTLETIPTVEEYNNKQSE